MAIFREKIFVAPLLAAVGGTGGLLNGGLLALTGGQMIQGSKQAKEQAAQAEQAAEDNRRMTKAIQKLAEKNPTGGVQAGEILQRGYSAGAILKGISKEGKALGKVGVDLVRDHRSTLIGGILSGGAISATSYGVDKAVQADMKRSNISIPRQKQYTVGGMISKTTKLIGKEVGRAVKKNKSMIGVSAVLGAAPVGLGYISQKSQLKDQVENTRQYSVLGKTVGTWAGKAGKKAVSGGKSAVGGVKGFFKAPLTNTLSGISSITGGGGKKGVAEFGKTVSYFGKKRGSKGAQKLGNFITNNPKSAMTLSVPVGLSVYGATWGKGEKLVKNAAKKFDKDAYIYQDSQEQQIQ